MVEITCSTTLFTVGTFPMVFVLEESNENEIVAQMIKHGGGCIASSRGPYGISLSSKNLQSLKDKAIFSTKFIKDCCMANRILDINQYRLGGPSSSADNINVMKILLRQSHWPTFARRDENDPAQTDRDSDSDTTMDSRDSRRNIGSHHSRTFSGNDEEEILNYIVENKEIGLILGNTLWKKIAQKKVQGRTWQSLKKHFLKHMLPNIRKYTFLSVKDKLEFQKHLQKMAESGDAGSSSKVVSQKHLEEQRSDRLPSPCASAVSNDDSSLVRNCGRRMPEKRKPFRMARFLESSDSDSDSHSHSHPGNTNDQRLQDKRPFNRFASSQVHRENKDNRHHRKEDDQQIPEKSKTRTIHSSQVHRENKDNRHHRKEDEQQIPEKSKTRTIHSSQVHRENKDNRHHREEGGQQIPEKSKRCTIQRQQSDSSSLDEVDSGDEEHHRAPVVQRRNEESRKSSNNSSPDNDWFLATDRERHRGIVTSTPVKPKTRKRRREEFTMEEEYAILAYLQKHNRFSNTGGNNVWKNMATTEPVGKRHTWQSLRERYLKKIVPNINKYNLPEEIKRRVKFK